MKPSKHVDQVISQSNKFRIAQISVLMRTSDIQGFQEFSAPLRVASSKNAPKTMKCNQLIRVFLVLVLISSVTPALAQSGELNLISDLKGNVQIKRSQWKGYQKANFGDLLSAGDLLKVAQGAMAKVTCSNLTSQLVPAGKETLLKAVCKGAGRTVLYRDGQTTSTKRSGEKLTLPYLISPRETALLGHQPLLRWHDINAAPYQVTVSGGDVNWSTTVSQAQVVFPGDRLPIKPGFRYWVTVVAQDGKQTASDDPVSFTFLSDEQVRQVQQDVRQVRQLSLAPTAQALALAFLYQHYDLKAEAIALLEAASKQGIQTTATIQLLGELYQQSGLLLSAKEQYVKALQLAKVENNLEGQALLQTHLGEVNEGLNWLKEALGWFQAAKLSYQTLGDAEPVKTLQAKIDDLSNRVPR